MCNTKVSVFQHYTNKTISRIYIVKKHKFTPKFVSNFDILKMLGALIICVDCRSRKSKIYDEQMKEMYCDVYRAAIYSKHYLIKVKRKIQSINLKL